VRLVVLEHGHLGLNGRAARHGAAYGRRQRRYYHSTLPFEWTRSSAATNEKFLWQRFQNRKNPILAFRWDSPHKKEWNEAEWQHCPRLGPPAEVESSPCARYGIGVRGEKFGISRHGLAFGKILHVWNKLHVISAHWGKHIG
jgi:hypothetical protein